MNKGWMTGLLICVLVSLQIEGGAWKKLKLWRQRKKIEVLENKSRHPFQLQRMGSCELDRCREKADCIATRLRSNIFTLREDEQSELRKRAQECSRLFGRAHSLKA